MAARLKRVSGAATAALLAVLGACGGPAPAATEPPARPTLAASPRAIVSSAEARLAASLAGVGLRLERSRVPYRPGEPATLQAVPRAVYRASLADPDSGWVVIYDPGPRGDVDRLARDFGAYLASGPGRTNYPRDAQFALNDVAGALVFSWWSGERSADPEQSQAAFEAIRSVGRALDVAP